MPAGRLTVRIIFSRSSAASVSSCSGVMPWTCAGSRIVSSSVKEGAPQAESRKYRTDAGELQIAGCGTPSWRAARSLPTGVQPGVLHHDRHVRGDHARVRRVARNGLGVGEVVESLVPRPTRRNGDADGPAGSRSVKKTVISTCARRPRRQPARCRRLVIVPSAACSGPGCSPRRSPNGGARSARFMTTGGAGRVPARSALGFRPVTPRRPSSVIGQLGLAQTRLARGVEPQPAACRARCSPRGRRCPASSCWTVCWSATTSSSNGLPRPAPRRSSVASCGVVDHRNSSSVSWGRVCSTRVSTVPRATVT